MKVLAYHEVLNQNAVNVGKYCCQLESLHAHLQEKYPSLVNCKDLLLLHNNTRPYVAHITREKTIAQIMEVLLHPPYSPELLSDYHLFILLPHFF